ncbi:MAG: hypothetical protein ACXWC3_14760, partial [Burkholderiales bacterium]
MTNVIQLRGGRAPVGQFIRIGTTGHRQVEDLIAEGRFPVERVVLDASALHKQKDLGETLRARGTELVLDTNASELSEIGRFEGAVRHAPWAHGSRPLGSGDFEGQRLREIVGSIATLAIDAGFSAVLAPAHLLRDGSADSWFPIDSNACIELRSALDRLGGRRIAIDYPLMIPYALLRDTKHRSAIVARLANLPIENLWVRTSSFGADATAAGVRRYIEALTGLFDLGLPIVADGIAGLVGFSTLAFGGAAAIAHGIGEHERFDTS